MNIRDQIITTIIVLFLLGLGLILSSSYEGWIVDSLRIGAGSVGLLFLPGYRLTAARFKNDNIDILEKLALSFAFSISIIPLLVFYLNLLGIPINEWLVYGTVVAVVIIGIIWERRVVNKSQLDII